MRIFSALLLAALATAAAAEPAEVVRHLEDNSFLLEEAYNQESGVVQNIASFMRDRDSKSSVATFTQEWPLFSEEHQLSFTAMHLGQTDPTGLRVRGFGDVALNYRYQALSDDASTACAPRFSLLLPTGASEKGLGSGGVGGQVAVPLSVKLGKRFVTHINLGTGWTPRGKLADGSGATFVSYWVGQSFVALVHRRFNVLVEVLWSGTETVAQGRTTHSQSLLVSPGLRFGLDFPGGLQVVPGIGVPIGIGPSANTLSLLGYLSFEFPFLQAASAPGKN